MDYQAKLVEELNTLATELPEGAEFSFHVDSGEAKLDILRIPGEHRGIGTRFMAKILAASDRHGVPTSLEADATDEPGDPSTFDLARWYARFGYSLSHLNKDERVCMHRLPRGFGKGYAAILDDYVAGHAQDLDRESFYTWLCSQHGTDLRP